MQSEFDNRGGKEGLVQYFKTIFKRVHRGETTAILIISSILIMTTSIWAYDNVHMDGTGPSYYDTNKEIVETMKRAKEANGWD